MKKKTLDRFINEVIGDVSQPFHIAFGAAKFSPTGKGEEFSSPCSLLGKLIKKRVGSKNFSLVDEWNTSKVCHRCNEGLCPVIFLREDQLEKAKENEREKNRSNENEEEGNTKKNKERRRRAIYPLRDLLRCSSQRKNNYNNNYQSNEDKENTASARENTPPTSSSPPPSPSFCPNGGMYVNRDSNAATNIALKFILTRTKNHQLLLPNLIRGVKVKKKKEKNFFWLDLNQKKKFYPQKKKKKKIIINNTPRYDDVYVSKRNKEEKKNKHPHHELEKVCE